MLKNSLEILPNLILDAEHYGSLLVEWNARLALQFTAGFDSCRDTTLDRAEVDYRSEIVHDRVVYDPTLVGES